MNAFIDEATIEITQNCPNKCLHCSSKAVRKSKNTFSKELIFGLLRECSDMNCQKVCISGGEPLWHDDFSAIMAEANKYEFATNIYTCGIDKKGGFIGWSNLASKTKNKIIFSIYSIDKNIHEEITGNPGSLQMTLTSLQAALSQDFEVEVHIVPMKTNFSSLKETIHDLDSMGVKKVSLLRLVPQGYAKQNHDKIWIDSNQAKELEKELIKLADTKFNKTDLRFGIPFSGTINQPKICNAADSKLVVRYDGKVLPCEAFKDEDLSDNYVLGDVLNSSLSKIYGEKKLCIELSKFRSLIHSNKCSETCPAQLYYSSMK
ncbi:radical SAM protein [Desulforegula conservatrix]|uniref:radical SAM protein n=1 Tax=Desulforegula conservatrix TaxID=153026 RepID=UPI00042966E3|nr:radical SAM protein [Desulforegula conservatrix]